MITTLSLQPGITLRCFTDGRFKQSFLSLQLLRPMCRQEASLNALLPAVLLRGTVSAPDLRAITQRLDDLYGAAVGTMARRVGDYQVVGLCTGFIDDRFAMDGDRIMEPAMAFFGQLLLSPVTENGCFREDYVESEKKNLIAAIQAQRNDKRAYASARLLEKMCPEDSFGIPRLGDVDTVRQITAQSAYDHYRRILRQSPVNIFYVGSTPPEQVARLLQPLLDQLDRDYVNLQPQTACRTGAAGEHTEVMDIAQGKLAMGFVTPVTVRDPGFAATQVCNMLFGGGMTSLLFTNIREKQSLCYDIGSSYHGSKGIVTVSAGIDCDKYPLVRDQVLAQLELCRRGEFSDEALDAAKQGVISALLGVHDSPGAIESYYATAACSGQSMTPQQYIAAVEQVDRQQVCHAARQLQLHTGFFLKGVEK